MNRIKLQYSPKEITTDLYTYGLEWMTDKFKEYKGLYHTYTTGEVYTQPIWNPATSIKLIPYADVTTLSYKYKQLKPDIKTKYKSIYPHYVTINTTDIKKTWITRYFVQRQTDHVIIEINLDQLNDINSNLIDPNLYKSIKLNWFIAGPLQDSGTAIKTRGVLTKNKLAVNDAEKTMPLIRNRLSNFSEFYNDTDFKVPNDINV
jgi:hypothetical protein